ncbi:MAG: rod shape-determining protein MreB [Pseudomonadota bacterium]
MAISSGKKKKILAIGSSARVAAGTRINPFDHPRVLVHDFQVLEKIFQHAFSKSLGARLKLTPLVVLKVDEELEGGLTSIECRALREAAVCAGAYDVFIHDGDSLTNQQVKDGVYKQHVI